MLQTKQISNTVLNCAEAETGLLFQAADQSQSVTASLLHNIPGLIVLQLVAPGRLLTEQACQKSNVTNPLT